MIMKDFKKSIFDMPMPSSISSMWNFGSLLGFCLVMQIVSGVFLSMHYSCDILLSFDSVSHIMRDVNFGWGLRSAHANGGSFFFICLYVHIARGIYYGSYRLTLVWLVGVTLLLMTMATAFLGYVLPWGQMSFWGATVITNLFSAIPFIGNDIVYWLWGGFAVDNATLTRFFSLHFLLPFLILGLSLIHLLFLHSVGSSNPLGIVSSGDKISFHPYFTIKDFMGIMVFFIGFFYICLQFPWVMGDPENFIPANPLVTPLHIQPEWYFLFAYAILRSIPNKLGGVLALLFSVVILYSLPFMKKSSLKSPIYSMFSKIFFWWFLIVVILLTWIGMRPVEEPFVITGQILTIIYFIYFLIP